MKIKNSSYNSLENQDQKQVNITTHLRIRAESKLSGVLAGGDDLPGKRKQRISPRHMPDKSGSIFISFIVIITNNTVKIYNNMEVIWC